MTRKILITGAQGQVGAALQRKLKFKYDVFPTIRATNESGTHREIRNLDITERSDVENALLEVQVQPSKIPIEPKNKKNTRQVFHWTFKDHPNVAHVPTNQGILRIRVQGSCKILEKGIDTYHK